jgi:hypothetical protein
VDPGVTQRAPVGWLGAVMVFLALGVVGLASHHALPARIGRHDVIAQIGEGGIGVVYKARDPHLDRLVAIKVISPARRLERDRRERLVIEAPCWLSTGRPPERRRR